MSPRSHTRSRCGTARGSGTPRPHAPQRFLQPGAFANPEGIGHLPLPLDQRGKFADEVFAVDLAAQSTHSHPVDRGREVRLVVADPVVLTGTVLVRLALPDALVGGHRPTPAMTSSALDQEARRSRQKPRVPTLRTPSMTSAAKHRSRRITLLIVSPLGRCSTTLVLRSVCMCPV